MLHAYMHVAVMHNELNGMQSVHLQSYLSEKFTKIENFAQHIMNDLP